MSTPITFDTLDQPAVVAHLVRVFGPVRAWSDFLADCIRGRALFFGHELLPVCYLRGAAGRCSRPLYHRAAVREFIRAAHHSGAPLAAAGSGVLMVELDPAQMSLPPRLRRPLRVTPVKTGP